MMSRFDDNIPYRAFDNFQFVSFTEQMLKSSSSKKEGDFALSTLMKSAGHFEAASSFQLDGEQRGFSDRNVLPPPVADQRQYSGYSSTCNNASVQKIASADSDMCDPLTAEGHKVTSAHRNPKFVEIDNVHHPDLESYLHMTESPSEELEDIECIEDRHGCRLKQEICSNDNGDISSTSDKTIVNWLSLPPGVVWRIWGSLCKDSDRQKMRFVSKEWYKEIPEVMARRPWVIGSGTIHGIFHSINGKSLSQMKFRCEIPDGSFYSSCSSFLVMQTDNEHFLWSPSNRMSLKLPLKTYEKIVMHEDSDSYAFAYSSGKVKFSYGRPQVESSWKQILCYDKSIGDICQCDNEYYAVSNMFRLYWLDQKSSKLELIGPEQTSNDIKKLLLDGNFPDHLFLADVNHELVIVAVGRNLRSVDLFKVLWISDRMTSLVRVPDLGIWSLFLGRNQAIALSADDFPGISPSTLYLALDPLMDDEEPTVQLYNLATRSVVDTGYPVHKLGSPFFYQPDIVSASVLYE
ncbi:hypothetical protein PVAP13_1KG362305 [Panicum virgatum]|nr:hypothetical protein PVAP13_1KG362305 [Panicum virgatum]